MAVSVAAGRGTSMARDCTAVCLSSSAAATTRRELRSKVAVQQRLGLFDVGLRHVELAAQQRQPRTQQTQPQVFAQENSLFRRQQRGLRVVDLGQTHQLANLQPNVVREPLRFAEPVIGRGQPTAGSGSHGRW